MQATDDKKGLFKLIVALAVGVVLGVLVTRLPATSSITDQETVTRPPVTSSINDIDDQEIIFRFSQLLRRSRAVWATRWFGIPSYQFPTDNWIMQEIISEIKPDFIIEAGTSKGGTTLFYATVLENINENGKVITVDIESQIEKASKFRVFKERVEFIKGDSVSSEVISKISDRVKNSKALVTLDSLHTKEHVSKELKLYSPFVSLNSYIVVQDTMSPGLMEAIEEFLETNKNFEIDRSRERFLITGYPSGYLKRIK
jgi:cephalosporin hydroxylase